MNLVASGLLEARNKNADIQGKGAPHSRFVQYETRTKAIGTKKWPCENVRTEVPVAATRTECQEVIYSRLERSESSMRHLEDTYNPAHFTQCNSSQMARAGLMLSIPRNRSQSGAEFVEPFVALGEPQSRAEINTPRSLDEISDYASASSTLPTPDMSTSPTPTVDSVLSSPISCSIYASSDFALTRNVSDTYLSTASSYSMKNSLAPNSLPTVSDIFDPASGSSTSLPYTKSFCSGLESMDRLKSTSTLSSLKGLRLLMNEGMDIYYYSEQTNDDR